ncbi:hypothetical protein AB0H69_25375 [Streptomyces phaeochromogenes]|uniref:hypothetical protein n=1 Tax=Streptomyces phaeochromogenes TaxID=1923 RepID=UPI0033DF3ECC
MAGSQLMGGRTGSSSEISEANKNTLSARPSKRAVIAIFAAVSFLGGCSVNGYSKSPQPSTNAQPPRLIDANNKEMPLDKYLLDPGQSESVNSAYLMSIANCMRRHGFKYGFSRDAYHSSSEIDAPKTRIDGRFGYQSMRHAEKWGYHPAEGLSKGGRLDIKYSTDSNSRFVLTGSKDAGEAFGPGGHDQVGNNVPARGCVGSALLEVTGSRNGNVGDAEISTDLKFKTLIKGQKDPRTRKVFDLWSGCMSQHHYTYDTPLDAISDLRWSKTSQPSATEIETAIADQECRAKHNVVGVWFAVDFEYQLQAVGQNLTELKDVEKQMTRKVKAAKKILSKT